MIAGGAIQYWGFFREETPSVPRFIRESMIVWHIAPGRRLAVLRAQGLVGGAAVRAVRHHFALEARLVALVYLGPPHRRPIRLVSLAKAVE